MTPSARLAAATLAGLAAVALTAACDTGAAPDAIPDADPTVFRTAVYPVLLADCAFPACHGDPRRFFTVYGPGRTRLLADTLPYAPATPEELALSFTRARSMLVSADGVRRAPLLRKPLAVSAGGAGHEGDDPWGASLYASKSDPRWQALFYWAIATEPGAGSEGP